MTSQQGNNFKMATVFTENEEDVFENFVQNEDIIEPYMFKPNKSDKRDSSNDSSEDSYSEEDEYDDEFEAANVWRLKTLCCNEKSLEYDKYDDILKKAESEEFTCITDSSAFQQNML